MSSGITITSKIKTFCYILPPIFETIADFLVNLPILLLYLITLPVRFFICQLTSITGINFLCVLVNLFPFISIICPLVTGESSEYSCYGDCPYCNTSECIQYPQTLVNLCTECQSTFSILNKIFCDVGVVIFSLLAPFVTIINVFLIPIIGKEICINVNPYACGG